MAYTDYTPQQASEIGEAMYERDLRAKVEPENIGKYIVINIENGEYEVGDNHGQVAAHLHERQPSAALYCIRIGYRSTQHVSNQESVSPLTASHSEIAVADIAQGVQLTRSVW